VSQRRILRYEVPVDSDWHVLDLPRGPIVHVAARMPDIVEFWLLDQGDGLVLTRAFQIFGTGQPIPPAAAEHRGTAITAGGSLVWHLMEHEPVLPGAAEVG
jgi:hypothetical protein